MGTGYTRNDTGNNIADGNIINASDLDGEYDAIQAAFDATTGHTHDGTTGEGGPIEVIGPTQDVVATASTLRPKTDNTVDLGTASLEYKDLFIDGTAHIDTLDVDENATITGTLGVTGATTLGTANVTTGNITTVNATTVDTTNIEVTNIKAKDGTAAATIADSTGVVTVASAVLTTADINGGTIDGTTIGGTTPAAITGTTITGTSFVTTGNMTFGDNDKAIFGAGSDLQIYHDPAGPSNLIEDVGAGDLILRGSNQIRLQDGSSNSLATFNEGTSVQLYYNNAEKLATTATGIDVTGTVTADGLTVDGDGTLQASNGALLSVRNTAASVTSGTIIGELRFESDDVSRTEAIRNSIVSKSIGTAGNTELHFRSAEDDTLRDRITISHLGDISFYEDTGTTPKFFWDSSAEALGIGTTTPDNLLTIQTGTYANAYVPIANLRYLSNDVLKFGFTGATGSIRTGTIDTGTYGFAVNTGGGTERMRIDSSGNVGVGTSSPAEKLDVNGTIRSGTGVVTLDNASQFKVLEFDHSGTRKGFVSYDNTNNWVTVTAEAASSQILFQTAGTERVRIDSSGNVGVGTSSPATPFHIGGSSNKALRIDTAQGNSAFYAGYEDTARMGVNRNPATGTATDANKAAAEIAMQATSGDAFITFGTTSSNGGIPSEHVRITSGGNVGIGTSGPTSRLQVEQNQAASSYFDFLNTTNGGSVIWRQIVRNLADTGTTSVDLAKITGSGFIINNNDTGAANFTAFGVGASERMRIDASGNVLLGTTDTTLYDNTSGTGVCYRNGASFDVLSASDNALILNRTGSDGGIAEFRKGGTVVGSISVTASATAYNTSSDYRLKEDVRPMVGAADRVLALNPVNFAWKVDGSRVDGFLAHEAQEVVPEAVTGEKDGEEMQAIDHSKLVPLLTAALQEALTEIADLKVRLNALEGQ